ncbi:MAG: ABC transporter ATP-binding protein, partial [Spirochaetota bacterium]
MIQISSLYKSYISGQSELPVLRDVTLNINPGEIVSIMGPSGAGKSTLLNIIGCLDGFNAGTLTINGKDVSRMGVEDLAGFRNNNIGFIFQMHNLLPEFTACENVMLPLLIRREKRARARDAAMSAIERFGLIDRAHHIPAEMSGGECQRIAVARALVGEPAMILADEPTGNLDTVNSRLLADILLEEGRKRATTIVIVTHDHSIASMTERTVHIVDGRFERN